MLILLLMMFNTLINSLHFIHIFISIGSQDYSLPFLFYRVQAISY